MAHPLISFCIPVGLSREPMLHASRQVGFRCLQQQMDVIGHPAIGKHFSSGTSDFFLQSTRQSIVVVIIMKERAASLAPRDNVIDRSRKLNTRLSRHGDSLAIQGVDIIPKTLSNGKPKTRPDPAKRYPLYLPAHSLLYTKIKRTFARSNAAKILN